MQGLLLVLQAPAPDHESFLRQGSLKIATSGLALDACFSLSSAAIVDTTWHHTSLPAYGFC